MAQDCGLNLGKLKGSLAKSTGRTGIFDSGPSDRDLADQIGSAHILIGAVDSGSSGSGRKGERPAAGVAGDGASTAEGSPAACRHAWNRLTVGGHAPSLAAQP